MHGNGGDDAALRAAPAVTDVVERVVGRFDGDDDDIVTLEELLAVLDPDGTRTTVVDQARAAVTAGDTDASGGMSVDELTAALTALDTDADGLLQRDERTSADGASALAVLLHGRGGHGGHPAATPDALTDRTMARFDADADGAITLAELVARLDAHGRTTAEAEAQAAALMAVADTSGDQQLAADEVKAVYTAADTSADGLVQWAELLALPSDYVALVGVGGVGGVGGGHHGHG